MKMQRPTYIKRKKKIKMSEQKFELIPEGTHKARLCKYIITGTHMVEGFQGAPDKEKPMILLLWELSEVKKSDGKPFYIKTFGPGAIADYDTDKSKKTEYFTSMFEDYVPGVTDAVDYLGKGCRVVIKHQTSKAGHTYAKLDKVRDYDGDLPELVNPAVYFDFYNPTAESLEAVAPWDIEYMQQAVNYKGSKLEAMLSETVPHEEVREMLNDEPSF